MRRRRKLYVQHRETLLKPEWWTWKMFWIPQWWILAVYLSAVLPCCCSVHVFVRDEKRYAVLFQSVVLPCQYTSVSTQTPVVQWVYKSYCRDRTRDSFSFTDNLGGGVSGGVTGTGTGYGGHGGYGRHGTHGGYGGVYETGTASYLDCADSSRTVRTVASVSGSSITLSEYYKNRDISIINKADLRIGEVKWGDSGVYICKVVISDDLEGQNEASVELLVLEWVFVGAVALGSVLFLLLVGICWCQCCPHSCCCYVSCWCCPDTCCCPRHLYEAGKGIKTGTSTPAYPPYFVSGVPAMVPIAPPSLVDKVSVSVPPSDGTLVTVPIHAVSAPYRVPSQQDQDSLRVLQYVEKQLAHFNPTRSTSHHSSNASELSSLHEGENNFGQTFRNVQKKALPAIPDIDSEPEPQRYHNNPPSPQRYHDKPSSPQRYHHNPSSPQRYLNNLPSPKHYHDKPSSPQHYRNKPPSPQRHRESPPSPQRYQNNPPSPQRYRKDPPSPQCYRKDPPSPQRYRKDPPSPQRYRKDPPSPQRYCKDLPSPQRYRDEPDSEPCLKQDKPPSQRRYSDDPPASTQSRRPGAKHQPNRSDQDHNRWNPRSEHLQRKAYRSGERTVSLDELEEFALSYTQRGGRGTEKTNYDMELQEFSRHPTYRNGLSQHYYSHENHLENNSDHEDHHRRKNRRDISPLPSPKKRRGTWDNDRPVPPPPKVSPPSSSSQEKDYDAAFLNSLLERKAKLRGVSQGKGTSRGDGGSDTPSKGSCNQSSGESNRHGGNSPGNRPDGDSLAYSDTERNRTHSPSWQQVPATANSRSSQSPALSQPGRREESREKPRKMNTLLSRDSLIV